MRNKEHISTVEIIEIDPRTHPLKPGVVAKVLSVSPRVISDLITVSLGEASIKQADGRGSRRVLSVQDGILLAISQKLRDYGLSPGRLRMVCNFLKDQWADTFPVTLFRWEVKELPDGKTFESPSRCEEKWLIIHEPPIFGRVPEELRSSPKWLNILSKKQVHGMIDRDNACPHLGDIAIFFELTHFARARLAGFRYFGREG